MSKTIQAVVNELGCGELRYKAAMQARAAEQRRSERLWSYYANPMRSVGEVTDRSERPYRQAQEWGIPARITGYYPGADPLHDGPMLNIERKEVVVENDIAWRLDTMVDYLFGRLPQMRSTSGDAEHRQRVEQVLVAIFEHNGGIRLLQQIALIGAVHGCVDVAVTLDVAALEELLKRASGSMMTGDTGDTLTSGTGEIKPTGNTATLRQWSILEMARLVSLRIIEPARTLLLTDPEDAMRVIALGQMYEIAQPQSRSPGGGIRRLFGGADAGGRAQEVLELWSNQGWWKWRDGELQASGGNTLGKIPVAHIQNTAVPFAYGGGSDVEALIPMQDELNTRLSDRAHRIAMQSFKMYLGMGTTTLKTELPAPGRVWEESVDADIKELGGDASCPAEDLHISEVREAMDKASGVPPVAAGAIRNRIGNLTSAAALRVTLMSLLARTERKRALYGEGLKRMCELSLEWLSVAGVFASDPDQRGIEMHWPDPLPESNAQKLQDSKLKLELGLGREVVLKELGY